MERASPDPARLPARGGKRPDDGEVEKAQDYLREALAEGPQPASDVENKARRRGIGVAALDRAKTALGVTASRLNSGHGNAVHLSLP